MPLREPRRRVLLLAWQGARAGIERHLTTLIRALPPRYEKAVAFLSAGGPIADELAAEGIPVRVLGMRRSYDPRGGAAVQQLVREGKFDLVHDHSTMAAAPILWLGLAGVPLVVTEHLAMAQRRLDQRLSYRLLSRFVDRFIANSNATRADLVAHGVAAERVCVVHHGLSSMPACNVMTAAAARAALGLAFAPTAPIVGFVGRLEPEKGCRCFVQVVARVATERPDARFVMVGDGSQRAAVVADIATAGLRDRVVLTGARAEVERVYPAFDVLVSSSQRETFGLAILEAMAAGVAVAAFNVGGVGELIDAETGELVEAGDIAALADRVVALLRDANRRLTLTTRARRVAERFTASRMAGEVAAVYDAVLSKRGQV